MAVTAADIDNWSALLGDMIAKNSWRGAWRYLAVLALIDSGVLIFEGFHHWRGPVFPQAVAEIIVWGVLTVAATFLAMYIVVPVLSVFDRAETISGPFWRRLYLSFPGWTDSCALITFLFLTTDQITSTHNYILSQTATPMYWLTISSHIIAHACCLTLFALSITAIWKWLRKPRPLRPAV